MAIVEYEKTFEYKLIYVFRIEDQKHAGLLKIGDATIHTEKSYMELPPNCHDLNQAAKNRIDDYTVTAGIQYRLLHTEIAVFKNENPNSKKYGRVLAFRDHDVHEVLKRSGVKNSYFDTNRKQNEWFKCDLETAIAAISAVKNNRSALGADQVTQNRNPIIFRPEQENAIIATIKQFKKSNRMLWNAKMRFGKTLTALEVAKRCNFKKTIIITHRPVVSDGWYEDFGKIFYDSPNYSFGSKTKGMMIGELEASGKPYVYFASMQDLRGSVAVGGEFNKNNIIFNIEWDYVVVDEAHEGTKTDRGQAVLEAVIKPALKRTKTLELSGTPFNLLVDYEDKEIYTWDYIMEQAAKREWEQYHFGDSNPYAELPKLNIFTYHLEEMIDGYMDLEDKAFKFGEFFRVWTGDKEKDCTALPSPDSIGRFVHEDDIVCFLDLICRSSDATNYPFSKKEYRDLFRHTLWVVPGVKEAKALSELLKSHPVFSQFTIANVAGDGDEDIESRSALETVRKAFGDDPSQTYSITLSCGRLTTGVSVPEWTAVLMLAGSYSTQASQYLQTIFRVQTPANINGRIKENCYVFDFAPDRTLRMVAESVQLSQRGEGSSSSERRLANFLNFCPVISIRETSMKEYKVSHLLQELKKAYAERVVRNGFDDSKLYNDELLKLDDIQLKEFEELKAIIGSTPSLGKVNDIEINDEGFTEAEYEKVKKIKKKPSKQLTDEEKALLDEMRKKQKEKQKAISVLRGISIRIPLLVYGADVPIDREISVKDFPKLVDDASWEEFMPTGVTKEKFLQCSRYYDKDIFVASTYRIRSIAKAADELEPTERVKKIVGLFSTFKNPDKETVLTPWRVVNMHLSSTIGGFDFWDEKHEAELNTPRYVEQGGVTEDIFGKPDAKILEINSKTGLYPLYVAYTLFRKKCPDIENMTFEEKLRAWDEAVQNNVFIICKTPMAKQITKRTLLGYRKGKINAHAFDDLINQLKSKQQQFVDKVSSCNFWNKEGKIMKFSAVVGNPPYQGVNHQQIYPFFYLSSICLGNFVSLIFPVGWQQPANANNLAKMNNEIVKRDTQIKFINNVQNVFPSISGAEWVNIILWEKNFDNGFKGLQKIFTNGQDEKLIELPIEQTKVEKPGEIIDLCQIIQNTKGFVSLKTQTSTSKPYGLRKDAFGNWNKYKIEPMKAEKETNDDITIYGSNGRIMYAGSDYKFPKISPCLYKYKVFVGSAWGNMSEKTGLGGAFADIILASPRDACTETYQESGCFDNVDTARKHAKYLLTKFCRACLYLNKLSQMSTQSWGAVPVQGYYEEWWNLSIREIDEKLFEKYNVPKKIKDFVLRNFQTKTEINIVNYDEEI